MDLTKWKTEFLEYLEIERGRSLQTTANYDRYLSRFFEFAKIKRPAEITAELVRRYRLWLNRQSAPGAHQTLKKNTQNYHLIALRSFLKFLARRGVDSLSPTEIDLAKTGARDLDLISPAELLRLLEAPDVSTPSGRRDRAILELLFSTGLRVSELCGLNRDTIDLKQDEFSIRGKGSKVRVVFVSPAAKRALKNYLEKLDLPGEALFPNFHRGGERLTPRSIERLVRHYSVKAGISRKVTPHVIRHSFATDLLRNGADLRSVQMLLGHANIATTQIYTHLTDKQLKKVHSRFHRRPPVDN